MDGPVGLLQVENVHKSYGGRAVVQGVSMSVSPARITGLLGPNGAGKTTTFYMVVGAVQPDEGTITLDGEDITRLPMHLRARRGIGYLAQEASIFRDLSVWDNVMAVLEFQGLDGPARDRRCEELLGELSLGHVKRSLGRALSGGERRRAEIARTLAVAPQFILLDEPFAGVDPIAVGEIQKIVSYLKTKGLGILITDHNVRETLSICDHTYVMNAGKILVEGGAIEIVSNPQARKIYLGENFQMTGAAALPGSAPPAPKVAPAWTPDPHGSPADAPTQAMAAPVAPSPSPPAPPLAGPVAPASRSLPTGPASSPAPGPVRPPEPASPGPPSPPAPAAPLAWPPAPGQPALSAPPSELSASPPGGERIFPEATATGTRPTRVWNGLPAPEKRSTGIAWPAPPPKVGPGGGGRR